MEILTPALQNYPWGSKTLIASIQGRPVPTASPEAELWFGAHSAAPSRIGETNLDELIAADPEAALGPRVREQFGDSLPFLMKLLAADEPLSIQAHPTLEQAKAGFERENSEGVALGNSERNYKDPNHKPELIVALTQFRALAGFRPLDKTLELFDALSCSPLSRYQAMLDVEHEEESLRALFTTLISLPRAARLELIDGVAKCASDLLADEATPAWIAETMRNYLSLNEKYPGDAGVLAALLLNYFELAPGEAVFLGAGHLHAYMDGLGVEIMANSDNVLRGGLTSKHIDVPELVRILNFTALDDPTLQTETNGGVTQFEVPVGDFILSRHELFGAHDGVTVNSDGPAIVLCTRGSLAAGDVSLGAGQAAWVPANEGAQRFTLGQGCERAEVFYARV